MFYPQYPLGSLQFVSHVHQLSLLFQILYFLVEWDWHCLHHCLPGCWLCNPKPMCYPTILKYVTKSFAHHHHKHLLRMLRDTQNKRPKQFLSTFNIILQLKHIDGEGIWSLFQCQDSLILKWLFIQEVVHNPSDKGYISLDINNLNIETKQRNIDGERDTIGSCVEKYDDDKKSFTN